MDGEEEVNTTNTTTEEIGEFSDTYDEREYRTQEAGEGGEQELCNVERIESTVESINQLELVIDPKLFLMEQIKDILYNLITDRPENVIDYFEEYVRFITTKRYEFEFIGFEQYFDYVKLKLEAEKWPSSGDKKGEEEEELEGEIDTLAKREPIFANRMDYFSDGGIRFTTTERFGINLALQMLGEEHQAKSIRFWGKIFGLYKNYYVMEMDVTKVMLMNAVNEEKTNKENELEEMKAAEEEEFQPRIRWEKVKRLDRYIKPPTPQSTFVPIKFAPKEKLGTGLNRKVYFVSNQASEGYFRLPDVLPIEIVRARQMKRFLTGVPESEVNSDPPFPGTEMSYLRAQIARISAGTQLSPLGYYSFELGEGVDEEEEIDEEEVDFRLPKPGYSINPDFEPIPLQDIIDPTMSFWVHHSPYILPQGRTKWVNPYIDLNKMKGEGGEQLETEVEKPIPEFGPPLLTSASDDMNLEFIPPWSTRLTMEYSPAHGGGMVRSNLWPGAFGYCLYNEIDFENVYVGWGLKLNARSFTPVIYFLPQDEYPIGPEILEIKDPDPEEEDYEGILYYEKLKQEKEERKALKEAEGE